MKNTENTKEFLTPNARRKTARKHTDVPCVKGKQLKYSCGSDKCERNDTLKG